ncbi:hypothetical protein [Nocardia arizonensis]|uniref:hypothetical protein n=1 Tax=Nocardia arizonensis TaxID=1141647 RepID=UPI0006D237B8|nr:hypothetical protein [Nocardia arizonensis]
MSRDLPFDGDAAEVTDPSGDTAYRVANGVARVARAGAYVTGGALVASNGGGVPAAPGGQRLDSWHTGWSGNNDPDPDVPSPVMTFPDPEPDSAPPAPSRTTLAAHTDQTHGVFQPGASAGDTAVDMRGGAPHQDAVTGFGTDDFPGAPSFLDAAPGYDGTDAQTWSTATPEAGLPDWWTDAATAPAPVPGSHGLGLGLPDGGNFLTDPSATLFGLPKHAAAERARVGELTETVDDNAAPGNSLGFGHSVPWAPTQPVDGAHAAQMLDGLDDFGVYVGVDAFASLYTELEIDFGVGPNGAYLTTEMKVEASAGMTIKTAAGSNIGDQLDNLTNWLDGKSTTGAGRATTDQHGIGSGALGSGSATAGVSGGVAPVAPAAASAPVFAPTAPVAMTQAPVAPPAPAPMAAAPAAAPVVAVTPLQTTIQPEAASSPIANVLAPPSGTSPLTAPAAAVPALFDQQHSPKPNPYTPVQPKPVDTGADNHQPTVPVTKIPTTFGPGASTPGVDHTAPDPVSTSVPLPTKLPGVDGKPTMPSGDIDITTTKVPGATRPAQQPSTPDGTGTGTGGTQSNPPSQTHPSTDAPSAEVPTVSVPSTSHSVPTYSPSQPSTIDVPTVDVPTAEVPSAELPTPTYSAPHPAPVTPIKPQVGTNNKPISDQWDSSHGYLAHPAAASFTVDADHMSTAFAGGGLSAGLLPGGGPYDLDATHGTLDHHSLLH